MENLIHTSFPPLQVSFGPLMGIYYFLNTLNWTVRSIIQLLLKNLAFTFSGGGSSDSQIQVSYKNSSLVSINTRFYCPLLHELHTASAFSIPELFLAFNPFQIEEPSNLLFFFFSFFVQNRILLYFQSVDGWFLGIELVFLKNGLFFGCLLDFTPRCGHQVWS